MAFRSNTTRLRPRAAGRGRDGRAGHPLLPSAPEISAVLTVFTVLGVLLGIMQLLMLFVDSPWMAALVAVAATGVIGVGYVCCVRLSRRWPLRVVLRTWVVVAVVGAAAAVGGLSGFAVGRGW